MPTTNSVVILENLSKSRTFLLNCSYTCSYIFHRDPSGMMVDAHFIFMGRFPIRFIFFITTEGKPIQSFNLSPLFIVKTELIVIKRYLIVCMTQIGQLFVLYFVRLRISYVQFCISLFDLIYRSNNLYYRMYTYTSFVLYFVYTA